MQINNFRDLDQSGGLKSVNFQLGRKQNLRIKTPKPKLFPSEVIIFTFARRPNVNHPYGLTAEDD